MPVKICAALLALTTALTPIYAAAPAPVAELVKRVDIPYEQFTLPNGLRVVVHTDRKAPVVAVAMWYHIGSKDEPVGKSGFAHLFEHLMFAGSEHAKGSVIEQMEQLGATDLNGTTWFDRTNYFETVPTGALDRALFIESDRMGYLLGGVPQSQLDLQRGVVQNEKRQGDNQPYGLVEYAQLEGLFPKGHPYYHTTIGSMADLDKASLADVRAWFRDHYAPNNAVLVLAGDIDLATAKEKAARWFGKLKRGPAVVHPAAPVPTLAAPKTIVMKDRVATTRITRDWVVPGESDAANVPLELAGSLLGGLASSRFDNVLVRAKQLAVHVEAGQQSFEKISLFEISMDVKPGVDSTQAGKEMDAIVAQFLKEGPSRDELSRAATRMASGEIKGLEAVSGKAAALGAGATYQSNPGFYKTQLNAVAAATPAQVRAVAAKWLSRPALTIIVEPGTRPPYHEAAPSKINPAADKPMPPTPGAEDRKTPPPVSNLASLAFPAIERTTLSNGIPVYFAKRSAIPAVEINLRFDAGYAADAPSQLGAQGFMLNMLSEGTTSRSAKQIAEDQEALGATVSASGSTDRTGINLSALSPNLAASLDLMADIALHPAFASSEIERVRAQRLAAIDAAAKSPREPARRALFTALYGPNHPYGRADDGLGDMDVVKSLSKPDLEGAYHTWLRPDNAQIFVVGDTDLATIKPMLEARFGTWEAPATPKPVKDFSAATPAVQPRIILVDRPNSPQSYIMAGHLLNATGRDNLLTLRTANEALGGNFLSRINKDLRETKGWSYGTGSAIGSNEQQVAYYEIAPVQADKTGAAIKAYIEDATAFLGANGISQEERDNIINADVRSLPGDFERASSVMTALQNIVNLKRPDDYYTGLPAKYAAMTPAAIDAAARAAIDPKKLVFVVVGEAAKVKPQLEGLGLTVEMGK